MNNSNISQLKKTLFVVFLFALSMGLMESSVVIYLRELYYPEGFKFPIKMIPPKISIVEIYRELATLIMLFGVGYLTGKTKLERFAYFIFAFAIWDLAYYLFLYVFIAWPESIFTWDLLFLIPFPWTGPVWSPILISLLMICFAFIILKKSQLNSKLNIHFKWWILLILGSMICFTSFVWDFLQISNSSLNMFKIISSPEKSDFLNSYIPQKFNTLLFFIGFILMLIAVLAQIINPKKTNEK